MNKEDVVAFFDSRAELWDAQMIKTQWKIDKILDVANIDNDTIVLDVACGTGVLVPDYLKRNVKKYIGIDISKKMLEIAKNNFQSYKNFEFICADAETVKFSQKFDSIIIYNAFPHFVDSKQLFFNLAKCLKDNGRITIAHSMSREDLIKHHSGDAEKVSKTLPEIFELSEFMNEFFDVDFTESSDELYIISATKN